MKEKSEKLYLLSEADKCAFFEKIFKELHIALVDSDRVAEVKWIGYAWLKKLLPKCFSTLERTAYHFGNYAVIWESRSNKPVFITELNCPFELYPADECDFFLCKTINDVSVVERYSWEPSERGYIIKRFADNFIPEEVLQARAQRKAPKEFSWNRLYPHKNIETKSVDNTIFYDFIVKFAE